MNYKAVLTEIYTSSDLSNQGCINLMASADTAMTQTQTALGPSAFWDSLQFPPGPVLCNQLSERLGKCN